MRILKKLMVGAALAGILLIIVIASTTRGPDVASAQTAWPGVQQGDAGWAGRVIGEGRYEGPWYERMAYEWGATMQHWMGQAQMFGQQMMHGWFGGSPAACGPSTGMWRSGDGSGLDCGSGGMMGR